MKTIPLTVGLILGCGTMLPAAWSGSPPGKGRVPIDQVPMYGGMDRQAEPILRKADEDLITGTSAEFGGREQAAQAWIERAFKLYKAGDQEMAMRRFNQAWLLDPKNPEVYWGFGAVLHDWERPHEAYDLMKRAYDMGFRGPGFLADFGKVAVIRIVEKKNLPAAQRAAFIAEGEGYFQEAVRTGQDLGYVHGVWASAKYWAGDYAGAWQQVKQARAAGGDVPPRFRAMLAGKLPEPK